MKAIPAIDLRATFTNNQQSWDSVAGKLAEALHDTGFVYLTGHGIDLDLIDRAFEVSKSFFELPLHKKQKYVGSNLAESYAGYFEARDEKMPGMKNFEYKECYNIDLSRLVFPTEPAEFSTIINDFLGACVWLEDRIFRLLATGVGITDVDEFLQTIRFKGGCRNQTNFKLVRYPALPKGKDLPGEMVRCGEHTDWGALTFLFQDDVGGLEARTTDDEWVPVPPIPGSIVVNVGEMLEKLTGGYLRATPHRVLITQEDGNLWKDRYSLVFFVVLSDDTSLKPIKSKLLQLHPDGEEDRPMTAGEYLLWRKLNHGDAY